MLFGINSETTVEVGDTVQVAGYPKFGNIAPFIENATVRSLGKSKLLPRPVSSGIDSLLLVDTNRKLVEIEAYVEESKEMGGSVYYMLRADTTRFEARIKKTNSPQTYREGSLLALTGVMELMYNPLYDDVPAIRPFVLNLRDENDVRVIKMGPWLTASRTRWLSAGLLVLLAMGIGWTFMLRQQIHSQTSEIRHKNRSLEEANKEIQYKNISLSSAYEEAQVINDHLIKTNDALEDRTDQLRDALEKNKEILGITAHDLKNPLSGIIGLADIVLDDTRVSEKATHASAIDNLPLLKSEAERMLQIIKDLLDRHREGNAVTLKKERTLLQDIVIAVTRWNKKQANDKEINLHYSTETVFTAEIDVMSIQRVLDNFVSNAIKYSPAGSNVWIRLERERLTGSYIRVSVKDEGPGLTEEDKQKVFGKMQRLSAKPTAGEHSSGLGLFIVKQLVEAHGGQVGVDSKHGHGATFWFTLPELEYPEPINEVPTAYFEG